MRAAIISMAVFTFLSFIVLPVIFGYFFDSEGWDWFPIYSGMILLSGLIVICTKMLLEEIDALKEKVDGMISKNK